MLKIKKIIEIIEVVIICIILFSGSSSLASYRLILIFLAALIAVAENVIENRGKIQLITKNCVVVILYCIIMWYCMQLMFTYNLGKTIQFVCVFLCIFLFCWLKNFDKEFIMLMYRGMFVTCMIIAISILLSVVNHHFVERYTPFLLPKNTDSLIMFKNEIKNGSFSGFACERAYAAFSMLIGFSIILVKIVLNKKNKMCDICAIILFLVALFSTGKRMLLLIAIFVTIITFIMNGRLKDLKKYIKIISVVSIGVVVLCVMYPSALRVFDRFIGGNNQKDTIASRTENYWIYCVEMFKDKPITGYGVNSFVSYISKKNTEEVYNAHNIYLQLLGETGIVGLVLNLCLFFILLFYTYKKIKFYRKNKLDIWIYIYNVSFIIQIIFLIYGLSGNTYYYFSQLFLYFIMFGIYCSREDNDEKNRNIYIS